MPAVLNAANEVAVAAFLFGLIPFPRIAAYAEDVLASYTPPRPTCLADVLAVDSEARAKAHDLTESARIA
jgi:1-deoxy-D-xylulose-5-phosphate reductoisomerase